MPRPSANPWESDGRLTPDSARVGARIIYGTFAPLTVQTIAHALQARALAASGDEANEAFLLAFYLRDLIRADEGKRYDVGQGSGIGPVAPSDEPVGGDTLASHGLRADDTPGDVEPMGEGGGSLLEVRDSDGLGNPWVRSWRLAWGLR